MKERTKLTSEQLFRKSIDEFKAAKKNPIVVVLDNVRSMNNVGSIFRTCDAFLVEELLLCGITPKPPHRDIQKTALGATESVQWRYEEDSLKVVKELKTKGPQFGTKHSLNVCNSCAIVLWQVLCKYL